ncbi:YqgE/AlgH family protein [Falsihalocynthiibacter sp. SS001]|uniref:YqgE/AlgH family protein n=1 Tax=Falsihalocynthiibacter sp. SS001 TaxID=3349698 RepID=UPI0036D2E1FA
MPFLALVSRIFSAQTIHMETEADNLSGKFLIAMPGMGDTRFDHSVVYLCAHSEEGAMGIIVNKPSMDIKLDTLLEQLEIPRGELQSDIRVHFGGPVEHGRGFVLHSTDYSAGETTLQVTQSIGMTATLGILEDMSSGHGPQKALLALGYAGWGPGQLEAEILSNGWLTCDATTDIVFDQANSAKWDAALATLGISPLMLSSEAGHA